jgi:hypothetical protein
VFNKVAEETVFVPQIVESAEEYIVDDPVLAIIFKFEEKFVPGRRDVFHEGSSILSPKGASWTP